MSDLELYLGGSHYRDEIKQHFESMLPEFRRKYYLDKSPRNTQELTIAVHARRGWDLSPNVDPAARTETILRVIRGATTVLDSQKIQHKISVYSEGNRADFEEFFIPGISMSKFRIGRYSKGRPAGVGEEPPPSDNSVHDIDAISGMKELIEADILIMSKSSFSCYAAFISDGVKFISNNKEDQQPLKGWIPFSQDGSFDRAAFERQLFAILQNKTTRTS